MALRLSAKGGWWEGRVRNIRNQGDTGSEHHPRTGRRTDCWLRARQLVLAAQGRAPKCEAGTHHFLPV